MTPSQSALRFLEPHAHLAGGRCPYCDQPIPNDKAEQVRARWEAKERERTEALTQRLTEQFASERTQLETAAREEGKKTALAQTQERIASLEQANAALKANQEDVVSRRVQEVREAIEKHKNDELNAKDAKHFEEKQKLTSQLADMTRKLERKTADELGEGAEVNLFETLKAEFEDDKVERIGKGTPGADIRHVVMHNGKECGSIVYESKNSRRWLNDYVDKLARDQRAAKANHAILSTFKLPGDTRQVHVDEGTGVIIANPARVLALVQVLRKHIIHVHTLRLSNTERAQKTTELYDFITSERCAQLLDAIDTHAGNLLELQVKEREAHERTWKQQGTLYRSIQKARADLGVEIDRIIEGD